LQQSSARRTDAWSPDRSQNDDTDYAQRHFANLVAVAFILILAIASIWTIKLMLEHEKLQACIDSGRRDCQAIDAPPRSGTRIFNR